MNTEVVNLKSALQFDRDSVVYDLLKQRNIITEDDYDAIRAETQPKARASRLYDVLEQLSPGDVRKLIETLEGNQQTRMGTKVLTKELSRLHDARVVCGLNQTRTVCHQSTGFTSPKYPHIKGSTTSHQLLLAF